MRFRDTFLLTALSLALSLPVNPKTRNPQLSGPPAELPVLRTRDLGDISEIMAREAHPSNPDPILTGADQLLSSTFSGSNSVLETGKTFVTPVLTGVDGTVGTGFGGVGSVLGTSGEETTQIAGTTLQGAEILVGTTLGGAQEFQFIARGS